MQVDGLPELEQDVDGVDAEVSQAETSPSTAQDAPVARQPEQTSNLDDNPEFRKWKSQYDLKFKELEQRHNQQIAYQQQQAQQMRERQLAEMDEPERVAYERDEAIRAYNAERAEKDQLLAERNRTLILSQVATKYKVPIEALEAAQSPDEARDLAWEWRERQLTEASKKTDEALAAKQAKREANKVDVGNGLPAPAMTDWEREEQKHLKSGDTAALYRAALTWKS